MKRQLCLLSLASLAALSTSAHAQGLLSIGQRDDFEKKLPFAVTVGLGTGWDSNVNLSPSDEQDSMFMSGKIIAEMNSGDRRTSYSFGVTYNPFYYFDAPEGTDEFQQSASVNFALRHRVNPRLTITDNAYFAYEYEPNYQIGASASRRTDPYIYGYNNLNVAYAWTKRFSTVTGYTISGIDYDSGDSVYSGQSFLTNLFSQDFRYAFTKVTTGVLTYRYGMTEYDNNFGDYTSQYLLAGVDHSFSRRTVGSFRAGAELRDFDNGGSDTNPYAEASFSHSVAKQTMVRWFGRYGYEDSSIGSTSFRTGLTLEQRFTNRIAGNVGLNYITTDYEGNSLGRDEDVVAISLGLDFNVYRNLVLNTNYSYTTTSTDSSATEYDRSILSVGMTAKF